MHLKGVGIDIFEKKRMKAVLSRKSSAIFLKRVFRLAELKCFALPAGQCLHFSIAFALKEAVLKAMGMGLNTYTSFCDIEVQIKGKKAGITLSGKIKSLARRKGVKKIVCDYSVSPRHVVAVAVLVS